MNSEDKPIFHIPEHRKRLYVQLDLRYGRQNQFLQLAEEMSELMQAVSKYNRGVIVRREQGLHVSSEQKKSLKLKITEEIADTLIMIEQVMCMLDIKETEILDCQADTLSVLKNNLEKED